MEKKIYRTDAIILMVILFFVGIIVGLLYINFYPNHTTKNFEGGYFLDYYDKYNDINLDNFEKGLLTGNSMYPAIPNNSIVIIAQDKIKIGDIIVFENYDEKKFGDEEAISHRVINLIEKNNKTYYKTKGDNVRVSEGWVSEDYVKGKIVGVLY